MKKKILLPTVDLGTGGVSRYIRSIQQTFPDDVELLELKKDISWRQAWKILKVRSLNYEQIWIHHIFPLGTAAMLVYFFYNVPYTIFLHGLDFDQARRSAPRRFLAKMILKAAQNVVTNSKALADEVLGFTGGVEPLVVYPCVGDDLIDLSSGSTRSQGALPAGRQGDTAVSLLTVGRLVARKGHIKVLEAIKDIPGINYVIVGDGPERSNIELAIVRLRLSDRVQILIDIDDNQLPEIYRQADIFIMPSAKSTNDREGFGIVYLEAGLFSLPVIATNQPGVDEAVLDGQTGLLIDGSVENLKIAIFSLLNDKKLRNRLGQNGRERVLNYFSRPDQFEKLRPLLTLDEHDCEDCSLHQTADRPKSEALVSVVIPTFQHAQTLAACLDSVLAQTYPNIEIIVVNDGSTDNTLQVLEAYKDQVKIISQENRGSNPARNRGWREATGEFIIFCDADVRMRSEMIDRLVSALYNNPQASYAYSAFRFGWKRFGGIEFSAERLLERNFIHTSCLVRRADFPGFDEKIKRLQDWDVWLTMLEQRKVGVLVPDELFSVTISGASRIGSSWLPSFIYRLPWSELPWKPRAIVKYEAAREIIKQKHQL